MVSHADPDKAREDNGGQHSRVEGANGLRGVFTQISGLVARRIVPWVKPGDAVAAGPRVGLIRFCSRFDVYLPTSIAPQVMLGQRTIAGETIVGRAGVSDAPEGVSQ